MTVQILRASDRLETPWKNGGGVTREIAAYPPGAGLDDFDWRVSMATVSVGGRFSIFPGVDRVLAVLQGELRLAFEGGATLDLTPQAAPATFSGDISVEAETPRGAVTDLNVMTRRGRVRAHVGRAPLDGAQRMIAAETTLVVALSANLRVGHVDGDYELERLDTALIQHATGERFELSAEGSGEAIQIDFLPWRP